MSAFETTSSETNFLSLPDVASALENLLVSQGRGGAEKESDYQQLRRRLLDEAPEDKIPSFLRTCRNLQQFWGYIKKWPRYAERDEQIWSAFAPLHGALERHTAGSGTEEAERVRPIVTARQRTVLEMLHAIYLETHDWPTHAYLEQQLEEQGIDLDEQLQTMPELMFYPDNRRGGAVLYFQDGDRVALMVRGLVACRDVEQEVRMFLASIRWGVAARRLVKQRPHEVAELKWRAADVISAMEKEIGANVDAYKAKLVLELMRTEPVDLPKWSGVAEQFPDWQIEVPRGIKRFASLQTIDDYLDLTTPKPSQSVRINGISGWPLSAIRTQASAEIIDHAIFGRPVRRTHTFDCFVLLPLKEPFKIIYSEAIEPVAAELGISCGHAEGIFGPGRIMRDIYSSITYAQLIVADLTGRNPNVFYELGIAHQQGKQVVLLSQSMDDVPFDVRDLRVVLYEWDDAAADIDRLAERLRPNMAEALRLSRGGQ